MQVLETERLILRHMTLDDAEFMLRLLNEPSFLENIGDRKVRNVEDAVKYIENGPRASYEKFGFGLFLVDVKESGLPAGICGLLKRDALDHPDIGFAFVPEFWSMGYGLESASAVLDYAKNELGIDQVSAITSPGNSRSIRLLEKMGFRFQALKELTPGEPEIKLFNLNLYDSKVVASR